MDGILRMPWDGRLARGIGGVWLVEECGGRVRRGAEEAPELCGGGVNGVGVVVGYVR